MKRHVENHVNCSSNKQGKAFLQIVEEDKMVTLFEHVRLVGEEHTLDQEITKIKEGIKKQTNQASKGFKLFRQMQEDGDAFVTWITKIQEQSDCCDWNVYGKKKAAGDTFLFQKVEQMTSKKVDTRKKAERVAAPE